MGVLDRLRNRKKTSVPQAETTHSPEQRAQQLISELVKELDAPNQTIINDLILLIRTLIRNPDPSIDIRQVVKTAEMLIHQLVKPISNPNQKLIDELLHLITISCNAESEPTQQQQTAPAQPVAEPQEYKITANNPASPAVPAQTQTQTVPVQPNPEPPKEEKEQVQQAPAQNEQKPAPQEQQVQTSKPSQQPPTQPAAPQQSAQPEHQMNKHMLNLIMEQTKEVVQITTKLNNKIKDLEDKTSNRISSHEETLNDIRERLSNYDQNFDDIQKAMDKFIGLYEIITNQFNPFIDVEHNQAKEEEQKQQEPPKAPVVKEPIPKQPEPEKEPEKIHATIDMKPEIEEEDVLENLPSNISGMIQFIKGTDAQEYALLIDEEHKLLTKWAQKYVKDKTSADQLAEAPTKAEASKILMKIALKQKASGTKA